MFPSLRIRLIVAFVSVIFLSLLLASVTFGVLLRGYQTQLRLSQLEDIAVPMSLQERLLERAGASPEQISAFLLDQANEMKVRILLLDVNGTVLEDTQGDLVGQQLVLPNNAVRTGRQAYSVVYNGNENLFLVLSRPRPPDTLTERFVGRSPVYSLVLAVPQQSVGSAWLELAPSLSLAALLSLVASVVVAYFLSRSISQPITAITRASEEMALGNYDQSLPVKGHDETGRMAATFNTMAAQVKNSHTTLRDFLANVSHELRTPLTSIQGFSQAMVDGAIGDEEGYASAGQIINEEAARMRRLVDDLLYLSRIESGQIPMEKLPIDLPSLVAGCIAKVQMQAAQANITIHSQIDAPNQILGDAHKLEQVVINLLDNALKHTPNGGSITVRTRLGSHRLTGANGTPSRLAESAVVISVHNSGSTIPADELDKVFERFYQVDKSRAKAAAGTGLGLAIVKEIVQAHGGAVDAQSEPTRGTEFLVYLPASLTFNNHLAPI